MAWNLAKNWPAYIFLIAFICFFIYVLIKGNLPEGRNEERETKGQDNTKVKGK